MMFWIEIKGEIDSRSLWEQIRSYNVNLTEVIEKTWVYGEAPVSSVGEIISICAQFGDLEAKVYEGGAKNEQAQKEEGKTNP